MKKNILIRIISFTMLIVLFCAGQTPVRDGILKVTVKHNYVAGLQHHNTGVVESAIFQIIILKTIFPRENLEDLREELNQLMVSGKTATIRYKAFIAATYLTHPEWFPQIQQVSAKDPHEFFLALEEIIDSQLMMLGVNPQS